jgi:hypothetical protein
MKSVCAILAVSLLALTVCASAREVVLPAGTLLQCTLNEPNFSSKTAEVGDPVLCHLKGTTEFGQQAFPRGSYLVGHLEAAKDPGHFVGKGYLKIQFDRIGLPSGDLPLDAKIIATRGYKVDKQGKIDGKGHATRDVIEWMIPPLWPYKVLALPARGPRPTLKGETPITLRLMDDVQIPQLAETFGPNWHFFGQPQNESYNNAPQNSSRSLTVQADLSVGTLASAHASLAVAHGVTNEAPLPDPASLVTLPGMPVFVLTSGNVLSVSGYGYQDNRLTYQLIGGGSGVISTSDVDWTATTKLNAQRGVRVTLNNPHTASAASGL